MNGMLQASKKLLKNHYKPKKIKVEKVQISLPCVKNFKIFKPVQNYQPEKKINYLSRFLQRGKKNQKLFSAVF